MLPHSACPDEVGSHDMLDYAGEHHVVEQIQCNRLRLQGFPGTGSLGTDGRIYDLS